MRLPPRRTARSCIASSAMSSGGRAISTRPCACGKGRGARSDRRSRPAPDWEHPRRAQRSGERVDGVRIGARARAECDHRTKNRGAPRGGGAGGTAGRVSCDRIVVDAVPRAARGARRRAPRRSVQANRPAQCGRDHRHARQLGHSMDHVGHPRRRDGGLSEPHVPAVGAGPSRRSGGRGEPRIFR